jgi:hypothetical protein
VIGNPAKRMRSAIDCGVRSSPMQSEVEAPFAP